MQDLTNREIGVGQITVHISTPYNQNHIIVRPKKVMGFDGERVVVSDTLGRTSRVLPTKLIILESTGIEFNE